MTDLAPDFMEQLAATENDPSRFSELVFGTPLHKGQTRYAENANAQVNFLLPGNSFGKTEFIARFIVWLGWFKHSDYPPVTAEEWLTKPWKGLVASFNYPIAKESFERLLQYHQNRPEFKVLVKNITRSDPARIELANGSVIDWGSLDGQGKLVEAARRQVIMVDEAGHIPDIATTFDDILFPRTMGVGGRIHLLGTPKAHSDSYLLEVYEKGKDGKDPFYYSQAGSVFENEFWPDTEKERVLTNPRYVTGWAPCPEGGCDELDCVIRPDSDDPMHPLLTPRGRQVIKGHFLLADGLFFNRLHVARLFTGDYPVEWHGNKHFHVKPEPGRLYLGAFDLGGNRLRRKGTRKGSDATVGFVVDYTERPWRIVRFDYVEGGDADWQQKYDLMAEVFHSYPMPYLLIDSTGQVDSVEEALQDRGIEVEGVHFGGTSGKKFDMLRQLQLCMELENNGERGLIRSVPIEQLRYELDHYVLPDDHIRQDCVMALAMLVHQVAQWELPAAVSGEVY